MNDSDRQAVRHTFALQQIERFPEASDIYSFCLARSAPINCSIQGCLCRDCQCLLNKYCDGVRTTREWNGGTPCESCSETPRPVPSCPKFTAASAEDLAGIMA